MADQNRTTPCGRPGCGVRLLCCRPDCPLLTVDEEPGLKRIYTREEFVGMLRAFTERTNKLRAEMGLHRLGEAAVVGETDAE